LKNVKIDIAINLPKVGDFLVKKAIFAMVLAGISFFNIYDLPGTIQPMLDFCARNVKTKIAYASSSTIKIKNPYIYGENFYYGEEKDKINIELREKIAPIIKNTPMDEMINDISRRDQPVAALLVAIAMKESKFGKYSPKKNGEKCFNYWGYRGKENTTASGYSCFDSPAHAIEVVGNRVESMVRAGANSPSKMIAWKCGRSCAGHSDESVRKWIADVAINYYLINPSEQLAKK
jgi:hypothetical protein